MFTSYCPIKAFIGWIVFIAVAASITPLRADEVERDMQRLQGEWWAYAGQVGVPALQHETSLPPYIWVIRDESITEITIADSFQGYDVRDWPNGLDGIRTMQALDESEQNVSEPQEFTIDPSQNPKWMDWRTGGLLKKCIYRFQPFGERPHEMGAYIPRVEEQALLICFPLDEMRPSSFGREANGRIILSLFRRIPDPDADAENLPQLPSPPSPLPGPPVPLYPDPLDRNPFARDPFAPED